MSFQTYKVMCCKIDSDPPNNKWIQVHLHPTSFHTFQPYIPIMYLIESIFLWVTGQQDEHANIPSLSDMLHKTLVIDSKTIINQSGKIQSYCGLRLSEIVRTFAGIYNLQTLTFIMILRLCYNNAYLNCIFNVIF